MKVILLHYSYLVISATFVEKTNLFLNEIFALLLESVVQMFKSISILPFGRSFHSLMPQNHKGFQLRYHPSGTLLCKFEHCGLPELSTISPTQKVLWVLLPALKPGDSLMAES